MKEHKVSVSYVIRFTTRVKAASLAAAENAAVEDFRTPEGTGKNAVEELTTLIQLINEKQITVTDIDVVA